jgi:two-component system nitrate/nitrite response regulator NarL
MTVTVPRPTAAQGPKGALRAVLVDDHQLLAQSLALALVFEGVTCTVAELADRESLLTAVLDDPPDLVLLDLDLGGAIGDGCELVGPFVGAGCRVLVVSASTDLEQVGRALELGASGVVHKGVPFVELLDTALKAARGEQVMEPAVRRRMVEEARLLRIQRDETLAPFRRLSAREAQVLRALTTGMSVGMIASAWFVSEATVRSQVRAILVKLCVSSQLEAVAAAHRSGWR